MITAGLVFMASVADGKVVVFVATRLPLMYALI